MGAALMPSVKPCLVHLWVPQSRIPLPCLSRMLALQGCSQNVGLKLHSLCSIAA